MPPPPPSFPERRKDHALRALYERVDTLEKLDSDKDKSIAILEHKLGEAVTYKWLIVTVLGLCLSTVTGAYQFAKGIDESTAKRSARQTEKLDRFIEAQAATNVKTEAMYLLNVERRPREEVREAVLKTEGAKNGR